MRSYGFNSRRDRQVDVAQQIEHPGAIGKAEGLSPSIHSTDLWCSGKHRWFSSIRPRFKSGQVYHGSVV